MWSCVGVAAEGRTWRILANETLVVRREDAIIILDQHLGQHVHAPNVQLDLIGAEETGTPDDGQIGGRHAIRSAGSGNSEIQI